jgi:hypothetical protein
VDRERKQGRDHRSGQDRARDQAEIKRLANKWRAMELDHPKWSHTFARHVDISDQQLARRAADGELPGGGHGAVPGNATKWQSTDAAVTAFRGLVNHDDFGRELARAEADGKPRFTVERPLHEVLGPAWRTDVHGRSAASGGTQASRWNDASVAVCHWQRRSDGRWHPVSCYPEPGTLRSRVAVSGSS